MLEPSHRRLFVSQESVDPSRHIIVHYRLRPAAPNTLQLAAAKLALLATLGTLIPLDTEIRPKRFELAGKVINCQSDSGAVSIAFPLESFSAEFETPQVLGVMKFPAEYSFIDSLWIEDVTFPNGYLETARGPNFGISGIRSLFSVCDRPVLGLILKPRLGVSLSTLARLSIECLTAGYDFVVDDELMHDSWDVDFSFRARVSTLSAAAREAERLSGEKKQYVPNISASYKRSCERVAFAKDRGVDIIAVNAMTSGFPVIEDLVSDDLGVAIITCNIGSAMMSRPYKIADRMSTPKEMIGVSEGVIAKLSRIAGADAVHTGITSDECHISDTWGRPVQSLRANLGGAIKKSMPVIAGGLNVSNYWQNIRDFGGDAIFETGSGVLNYPGGVQQGARAMRLLASHLHEDMTEGEATKKIISLAQKNSYLAKGLEHYGFNPK